MNDAIFILVVDNRRLPGAVYSNLWGVFCHCITCSSPNFYPLVAASLDGFLIPLFLLYLLARILL